MITAIYSLSFVHGAELWLLFWGLCVATYLGICFVMKSNRTKNGIKTMLIGLLIAEIIVDFIWAVIYYHTGTYLNYGIGAVWGLCLFIPLLAITAIVVTIKNRKMGNSVKAGLNEPPC